LEESTGQAVQESSQVAWFFLILYISFEMTLQMIFLKILSSFLTSFFHWYVFFSVVVQCEMSSFLLWIYGNHNPVTHLINFMKFNPYLSSKQADIWCPYVQDMCSTLTAMNGRQSKATHGKIQGNYKRLEFVMEAVCLHYFW
jgi:hypothetical protein